LSLAHLCRMDLDDVGANPARLAEAIHGQLGPVEGPVPVQEIALALDIVEVCCERLTNLEGALLTDPNRSRGAILVNAASGRGRQRYTLAHELGHFLNPYHRPTSADGFTCTRADMAEADTATADRHRRQEAEANRFAIELLAPVKRMRPFLAGPPDLRDVLAAKKALDISVAAAVRRYVELNDQPAAVVFGRNDRVDYVTRGPEFPWIRLQRGNRLPELPPARHGLKYSAVRDGDPDLWLERDNSGELTVQTLYQQGERTVSLLAVTRLSQEE
jgi:Zn-dependent peptidase ImmA (M78 family)